MIITEQVTQPAQRVLPQLPGGMRLAEDGEIAGQVRGDGERIVMVTPEPRVQPGEG